MAAGGGHPFLPRTMVQIRSSVLLTHPRAVSRMQSVLSRVCTTLDTQGANKRYWGKVDGTVIYGFLRFSFPIQYSFMVSYLP